MISNKHVDYYIKLYKTGKITLNKERILLIKYLQNEILSRDDLSFDEDMIDKCVRFIEKWHFELQPFQKFLIAFVFLFDEYEDVYFDQFFYMKARGAGKNGLISGLTHFFISELHDIENYNVSVVANTEKQAKTSFKDVYETNKKYEVLDRLFDSTKQLITNNKTRSTFEFHTSTAGSKDSLRDGCVIYDEIHRYENGEVVEVFSSGLGKVRHSREFFITTDGFVREGYLDKMKDRSMKILNGEEKEDRLFPFICKIDNVDEIDNPDVWGKANPMFEIKPLSRYARDLFKKVMRQYKSLENDPSNRENFMTKRMNWPEVDLEKSVAPWEEIMATNQPIPDLTGKTCIGGLDYGRIRDFAAVGLLFKVDGKYIWKTHAFVRRDYLKQVKLKVPIHEWEAQGLLTLIDGPAIDIKNIVTWFEEMRNIYGLTTIVADNFRMDLVRTALLEADFELEVIRNPKAIHSLLAPKVEMAFANNTIIFGDNPMMRWFTNNVYVKIKPDGNKEYLKIDEITRKTDGFQAFIHALYKADDILVDEPEFSLADINF